MPRRRRRNAAFADFLDDAVETAVDTIFDRAAGAVSNLREQARQQQRQRLPPEYRSQVFKCAACKNQFSIDEMEQVHPTNGWGTCRDCYQFMWAAGIEKMRTFAQQAAKRVYRERQQPNSGPQQQPGFTPPPPPSGPAPWDLLGVAQDASVEDIKRAYRQKAMMYHPDRVPVSASHEEKQRARQMFEAVTRARDVMLKVRSAPEA